MLSLMHQHAADIDAGDQLFFKFRRYTITEVAAGYGGFLTHLIGHGDAGSLRILVASTRKFWILRKGRNDDPLHRLRERLVPVRRRSSLPLLPGNQHVPVVPRDHVDRAAAVQQAPVGPGVLAVRRLIGSRTFPAASVQQVPYLLSAGGASLVAALHTGRHSRIGTERSAQALGQSSMVSDLCAPIPQPRRSSVGSHRTPDDSLHFLIPLDVL